MSRHAIPRLGGRLAPAATVSFTAALTKLGVPISNYGNILQRMRDLGIINGAEHRIVPGVHGKRPTMVSREVVTQFVEFFQGHCEERAERWATLANSLVQVRRSVKRMKL